MTNTYVETYWCPNEHPILLIVDRSRPNPIDPDRPVPSPTIQAECSNCPGMEAWVTAELRPDLGRYVLVSFVND